MEEYPVNLVENGGFEPPALASQTRCSGQAELILVLFYLDSTYLTWECQVFIWWRISDSNRSPTPCKGAALPDELIPRKTTYTL